MPKQKPRCPVCGQEIEKLYYTEYGEKVWTDEGWAEDEYAGDAEWHCPKCDCELDYEELVKLGVF